MAHLALLASLLLAAGPGDEALPVTIRLGETFNVCKAGIIMCPVSASICDDPRIAVVENAAGGAVVKALSVGTTLCSVRGSNPGLFRLMRVTVTKDPPSDQPGAEGKASAPR